MWVSFKVILSRGGFKIVGKGGGDIQSTERKFGQFTIKCRDTLWVYNYMQPRCTKFKTLTTCSLKKKKLL